MGSVLLLKREEEVSIAKRIERAQKSLFKTLLRSPLIVEDLRGLANHLRDGTRNIGELIRVDQAEVTEINLEKRTRRTLRILDELQKMHVKGVTGSQLSYGRGTAG